MCKHILFNDFQSSDFETLQRFAAMTYDDDGFGAIIRYRDNSIDTLKSLSLAAFYMELTRHILQSDIKTLVVHHRTSTNEKGLDYAHPFEFQGNYLTHNGVVRVPGTHDTKTKNDSESLLHHLIKTGFETHTIEGYFSCFILNQNETFVLVDNTAPIYSNGRIYSSHKIEDSWEKLELTKLSLCTDTGKILDRRVITVPVSTYGNDQKIYSLGFNNARYYSAFENTVPLDDWGFPERSDYQSKDNEASNIEEFYPRITDNIRFFFDVLSYEEEDMIDNCKSEKDMRELIIDIASTMGIEFTSAELTEVINIFYQPESQTASNW